MDWSAQMSGSGELALLLALLVACGVTLAKSFLPHCRFLPTWSSGRANEMLHLRAGSVNWEEIKIFSIYWLI